MLAEAPSREEIEQLLASAVYAPNHHETRPWRFFVLSGEARFEFGEVLAKALRIKMSDLDTERLERLAEAERMKPMRSPVLVVAGVVSERDDQMTLREDLQATSAAIQNMLLTAELMGLAAIWRTGDGAYDDMVKAHFGLRRQDQIAGIVYVGYPDPSVSSKSDRERDFSVYTQWRGQLP